MKQLYLDIHAIQTVPPSCVNRDDTGSPKTAVYGGVERARVSSQAWKRAMREYFKEIFAPEKLGSRTKRIPDILAAKILEKNPDLGEAEALKRALKTLELVNISVDEKKNQNSALFFISSGQLDAIAELTVAGEKDKKAYQKALKENPTFDILLFGRMVAGVPALNYDATSQVAHAISTHAVHTEYDYFAAVDDEQKEDESGAGHLGTVEFNSSTLYRYATVNVSELAKSLGEETPAVLRGFAEAFIRSMPTGKQNTFANRTLPDMVYITVREDQPVNFAGAFERPVRNDRDGYVARSCEALMKYAEDMYESFADAPIFAVGCGNKALEGHAEVLPLKAMLDRLEGIVADRCGKAEE